MRDHDHGKGVLGLDYTAHPSALDRLREVCERVAAAYDVHGVAAVHRVGSLDIGDVAVVVATTSAHRGTSFDASRLLIDTLKAEVPIWKHQRFSDGIRGVGGLTLMLSLTARGFQPGAAYRGGHGRRAGRAPEPVQGHAVRAVLHPGMAGMRRAGRACPTSTSSSGSSSR